ncbi:MAG TPA: PAS domain-containing protein [Candidatus Blautia pullistercoris]|mgnify:FL=1|uniref:histidine kinase n=1 Tax=Candidatus Blautia pullistercoris TaxID=2838499 RepID=A0A9D1VPU3_9FIRM|nr:PAS domain-containing protein [Clostridiales bacterium]HIX39009.1 PAS domain-containing protein [Candidatus Blautia pullistercoris]
MTKRIFTSIILASVIVLLASGGLTMGVLYNHFGNQLEEELRTEAEFLSIAVENEGMGAFDSIPSEAERITYIDTDGTVLFDNRSNADDMENHLDREEIQEAMEDGSGMAVRESDTLSQRTLYYALRLADGTVLRVSSTQYSLPGLLGGMIQPLLIILILMLILAGFLASRLAKNIVNPLNRLDLDHPEENQTYEEVAPLLTKINRQQKSLQAEIADAKRQQEEFSIITDNMEEGFLVIDSHTEVLSYNSSALRLLGAREQDARQSVLALNRSESFQRTVEKVLGGQHVISNQEFQGITCQVAANPVFQEGKVTGAVILILDVTEKMKGEQMRREFTANVSHELKTPLTSISGFAEIINDGFVKPEDTKKFAGRIFKEAQRLITLVNDVIKISQLDEGKLPYEKEEVDLYEAVRETFLRIEDHAKAEGVHLYLYGPHIKSNTVKTILDEIIYNLCDNGIKYNKKGGSLTVTISQEGEKPVVTVEDTGIGISEEDQKRIFERFYRVDKSHSKAIGGTGLGLSIVKHGTMFLGADMKVESTLGEGSKFILILPE